jgi:hypothetical protein
MAISIYDDINTGVDTSCGGVYWQKDKPYIASIANGKLPLDIITLQIRCRSQSFISHWLRISRTESAPIKKRTMKMLQPQAGSSSLKVALSILTGWSLME